MYTLLFDIDGTLIDTAGAGGAGMRAAISEAFGEPDDGRDILAGIPFAGRTDRAIVRDIFAAHGEPFTEGNFRTFLSHYVRRLPHTLAAKDGRVLPGVVALLDALAARGDVRLGLLTGNFRRGAELKLGHYGLAGYFHFDTGGFGDQHLERNDVARMSPRRTSRDPRRAERAGRPAVGDRRHPRRRDLRPGGRGAGAGRGDRHSHDRRPRPERAGRAAGGPVGHRRGAEPLARPVAAASRRRGPVTLHRSVRFSEGRGGGSPPRPRKPPCATPCPSGSPRTAG